MFDQVEIKHKEGTDSGLHLLFIGLTTCGYCKRAVEYLNNSGYQYHYFYLDELPQEMKIPVKREFHERFGVRMNFPTLIVDDEDYLVGFIEVAWDDRLKKEAP